MKFEEADFYFSDGKHKIYCARWWKNTDKTQVTSMDRMFKWIVKVSCNGKLLYTFHSMQTASRSTALRLIKKSLK